MPDTHRCSSVTTSTARVGFGRIGQAIAGRANGFRMRILYKSRTRKPEVGKELGSEFKPLDELLRESDFVVRAVPLTKEISHIINEKRLKLMKPTAILINIARERLSIRRRSSRLSRSDGLLKLVWMSSRRSPITTRSSSAWITSFWPRTSVATLTELARPWQSWSRGI